MLFKAVDRAWLGLVFGYPSKIGPYTPSSSLSSRAFTTSELPLTIAPNPTYQLPRPSDWAAIIMFSQASAQLTGLLEGPMTKIMTGAL
jgi:hypothetical protein